MKNNPTEMKRFLLLVFCAAVAVSAMCASRVKTVDNGGSGPFKSEIVTEKSLPGSVVYRPAGYADAVAHQGPLPLVVASVAANDAPRYEKFLSDIASYGYLAVASPSPNSVIDWAEKQNADVKSKYCNGIDLEYVGVALTAGAQADVVSDSRVKTVILLNTPLGDQPAAEKNNECSLLYLTGGDSDPSHAEAMKEFEKMSGRPVAFAKHLRCGAGGTYAEPFGGSYSRMAREWLAWQFKDRRDALDVFLRNRLNAFPDYTMVAQGFPESNEPFEVKEISIRTRDGKNLCGRAYIPAGDGPFATVIMAHGYNGTWREPQPYAETLAMRGIASYVFDFCGGSNFSRSDGSTADMSILSEKENVEDVAAAVARWPFVDAGRMALLGCSMGGLVSAITSAANPDLFKALVLVYPALMIPDTAPVMLERFDANGGRPLEFMGMELGRQFYEKINGMKVLDSIPDYKHPVFIVYGDKDMVASGAEQAKALYNDCETLVVPGGDHGFNDYVCHEIACGGLSDFLQKKLSKPFDRKAWHKFDPVNPDVHDPVMAYENGRYYMFTTGVGVGMMSSDDLKTWREEKSPLGRGAAWAKEYVPAYGGHTWAPDIIKKGDRWYLYYSCSTFGKNISAIGVATNKTLDPNSPDYKWEDLGHVVHSEPGVTDYNAIDPNVILAADGTPWLTFGSFWDGIQIMPLKEDMKTPAGKPVTVARRRDKGVVAHGNEHANTNAIEAPFITHRDGWYYLWVSYDYCCKGLSSNYKTAVARSRNVAGPYFDRQGRDMAECGGEILIAETPGYAGVGHCSVYDFGNGDWHFLAHAYDKKKRGASKLFHRRVAWTSDGWPEIIPD